MHRTDNLQNQCGIVLNYPRYSFWKRGYLPNEYTSATNRRVVMQQPFIADKTGVFLQIHSDCGQVVLR